MSCEIKEGDFDPVSMVKAMTIGAICEGIGDALTQLRTNSQRKLVMELVKRLQGLLFK